MKLFYLNRRNPAVLSNRDAGNLILLWGRAEKKFGAGWDRAIVKPNRGHIILYSVHNGVGKMAGV